MISGAKLSKALRVPHAPEGSRAENYLLNHDLQPVRSDRRAWTAKSYAAFWLADGCNINVLMIAASAMTAGLTWWEALVSTAIGYSISAVFVVLMGRVGASTHCGFPVVTRASFGLFGALWPVLNRAVMACVWQGVQAFIGGKCVTVVLRSIIPSYYTLANKLPESAGVSSRDLLSFFLFGLLNLVCVLPSPQNIRHLFTVKAVVAPLGLISFLAWTLHDAGGLGAVIRQPATVHGSQRAWAFVGAVVACVSNMATVITNQADFARLANRRSAVTYPQLFAVPLTFTVTAAFGILIAAGGQVITGTLEWDPISLLNARLDVNPYHAGTRAACFFIGFAFIIVQLGVNIAANSLSAGSDLTALLPRYINIRRGSIFCWAVGMAYCPWHVLSSSNNFATYLSAYSLFLSSIIGVILADYYVLRRGAYDVPRLFVTHDDDVSARPSPYYFARGINFRAFAGYLAGIAMSVTGFAGVLGADVSTAAQHMYTLSFFIGLLVSGGVYLACSWLFPVPGAVSFSERKTWLEPRGATGWEDAAWTGAVDAASDEETASSVDEKDAVKDALPQQQVNTVSY